MKTVVVVRPSPGCPGAGSTKAIPSAEAFEQCFRSLGWKVETTTKTIVDPPDLIAGYGWRPVMREAHQRWPERVLHTDLGFWGREDFMKLALGDRWSPLVDRDYDDRRLRKHRVQIMPTRKPGGRILVCGMSAKAADTWNLEPEQWERETVRCLIAAGATSVIYRPKPSWLDARPIAGAKYDRGRSIDYILQEVDAVVSHHSNAAIDALAAGLPIYVETGIAKSLSVPSVQDAINAEAPGYETRKRFLRQVAWHQWKIAELSSGAWLEPPAPLANHPLLE